MLLGRRGSWPDRAEMLRRAVQDPAVQGGEWSMAQYLYRIEKGDRQLRRPAGLSAAQLHGAGPVRPPGRPGPAARGPGREAHRHVQLHRQRLDLVPALPALRGPRSPRHRVVDRRHRHRPGRRRWTVSLPPGVQGAGAGPFAVGHADRRRAGGDLQPAAPAGLPSRSTAASPGCSRTSAPSSRSTSARRARSRRST